MQQLSCSAHGAVSSMCEQGVRRHVERVARMQSGWFFRRSKTPSNSRIFQLAALGIFLVATFCCGTPAAHAQSAGGWNRRGQAAETREDYDAAFEAYRQAHLKKPGDLRYKERYERLRFLAAATHVDRGRVLRQSGDSGGAVTEFTRALAIDPGNQAAAQELQITLPVGTANSPGEASVPSTPDGITTPTSPKVVGPGGNEQTPHQLQVQNEIKSLASPVDLQPVSNDPITLHMVEDTKVIYQSIGKLAGLNVIFDPDYTSKRIAIDLNNVTLWDALRIVGTLSKTFWKPITSNTLYVADNTNQQKRTEVEDLAVQTFYLTNVSQQNDANEVLIALRNLLDPSVKIYLVASQNAIVLRATPDQLVLAEKLINDLDRTRSEVVVDVAVLEVSRDKIRNLGITLPTSFGLTPQLSNANTSTSTTATSGTSNSNGTSTTNQNASTISLNTLGNLNATNFSVSLTGGTVNALLSDSDTRILQNPRIRATDGQRAQLKIGSKIPVATGSYSAGAAITSASLGVQTQFQYLDVGVNIDMTPTVHYDREISLKLKVEVSAQNGSVTISGVTEPIISQRTIEQVIQLREGEPSILAGILQKQDTKSTNGTPGLGEIPFLKYFFSTQGKEQQTDEIVFLLIPHIVRSSILTEDNTKPIYTGTGRSIELIRHGAASNPAPSAPPVAVARSSGTPITAANAAAAMAGQLAEAARPPSPPTAASNPSTAAPVTTAPPYVRPNTTPVSSAPNTAAAAAAANMTTLPVSVSVVPPQLNQTVGATFQVALTVSNANDLYSVPMEMHFDPKILSLVNVDVGELLGRDGQAPALVHRDDGAGNVTLTASRPPSAAGVTGQGTVATLTFRALASGDSPLTLTRVGAKDSRQNTLQAKPYPGSVHVK